jgi:transcriptional regulator with XRE-family HTH domain
MLTEKSIPTPEVPESLQPFRLKPSKLVPRRSPSVRGRKPARYADLNYQAIGAALGLSPTYVGRILNGHNKPSMAVAERLAALMGWTLDQVAALKSPAPAKKPKSDPEVPNAKSRNRRKRKPTAKRKSRKRAG